jgi:hypothetical protein
MAAIHVLRAFAEFFPSLPTFTAPPASASPFQASSVQPREVGQGAPNETFVTISGIPHLFVDEGDCIVQFMPAFEDRPRDTRFGVKILPELEPHWSQQREYRTSLKDAIATAIRSVATPSTHLAPVSSNTAANVEAGQTGDDGYASTGVEHDAPLEIRRSGRPSLHRDDSRSATIGRVLSWGEERFPSRKPQSKPFYMSFAMHIDTLSGERTLQGEGLKDAIAQSGCRVGDVVTVRRLEKIKVPAFTEGGLPIMKSGQQVLWDKWLWSITR